MSLNFDTTACAPDRDRAVQEAMIFHTMICGFFEITAKNLDQVLERIAIFEKIQGPLGPRPITRQDVTQYLGLRTNASTLTQVQFKNKIWEMLKC